jgi:hypothetical protein
MKFGKIMSEGKNPLCSEYIINQDLVMPIRGGEEDIHVSADGVARFYVQRSSKYNDVLYIKTNNYIPFRPTTSKFWQILKGLRISKKDVVQSEKEHYFVKKSHETDTIANLIRGA